MRKSSFLLALAMASTMAHAAPSVQAQEKELRFATLAVLSYGGFVTLVERECLPSKPKPTLATDWQKRHRMVLDSADAFADSMFNKNPEDKGGRTQSQAELAYVVGNASAQLYREEAGEKDKKQACAAMLAKVRSGAFDAGEGRRMQPHAVVLTNWLSSQKARK